VEQNKAKQTQGRLQRNDSTDELKSHWQVIDWAAERSSQARENAKRADSIHEPQGRGEHSSIR
jgi:hypothetical protein